MAAQVYGIQQYPVVEGAVGGLARLAQMIYERQDALEDRRDRKTNAEREFGLKEQELAAQREHQQGVLENQQGQRQENYASNWMRNELARQELEQRGRVVDCNGADKNTPACIQARQAGRNTALELEQFRLQNFPLYLENSDQVYQRMSGGSSGIEGGLSALAMPYQPLSYGLGNGGRN